MSVFNAQPFSGIATFGRRPYVPEPTAVDVAVLGLPFDGSVSYRSGTRFGPRGVREQSLLLWGYNNALGVNPFERLQVVDGGDVEILPVDIVATHREIATAAGRWTELGATVIGIGGEHSVTLPLLRAAAAKHGPLALVHFDAHGDTWNSEYRDYLYSHGTPMIRAIQEGLVDPTAYLQIGIRGPTSGPQDYVDARGLGAQILTIDDVFSVGIPEVVAKIQKVVGRRPVYLTFDIDAVDPAFAPGTGTPEVGGLTSYQALQLVRGCRGLNIVGADLVEVSPPFDPTQITSILGANLVFEFLSLIALNRQPCSE